MTRLMLFVSLAALALGCGSEATSDGGDCTGSLLSCSWAELSTAQEREACELITASISAPAGTKFECKTGEHTGKSFTVENAQACISRSYPSDCGVTVQQTLDCFKDVSVDACAAFADGGGCAELLATAATCE
ncbi:MAG TPA: hypothetical protein VIV11_02695 [Kofleriaceae bacterium]